MIEPIYILMIIVPVVAAGLGFLSLQAARRDAERIRASERSEVDAARTQARAVAE